MSEFVDVHLRCLPSEGFYYTVGSLTDAAGVAGAAGAADAAGAAGAAVLPAILLVYTPWSWCTASHHTAPQSAVPVIGPCTGANTQQHYNTHTSTSTMRLTYKGRSLYVYPSTLQPVPSNLLSLLRLLRLRRLRRLLRLLRLLRLFSGGRKTATFVFMSPNHGEKIDREVVFVCVDGEWRADA